MTDLDRRIAALTPQQRAVFESRLAGLTAAQPSAGYDRIRPRDRSRPTPLGLAQQREWAIGRFRLANNVTGALRLRGEIHLPLMSRVLTEILSRHEVLRSTVEIGTDNTPVQVVQPVTPVPTPVVDLSHLPEQDQPAEVRRRTRAEVVRPFDPADPQRLRVTLLRLAEQEHIAVFATDHAASDAWSLAIIVQELASLYEIQCAGAGRVLPDPEIQFGDFAAWQRERFDAERTAAEVRHWKNALADMPAGMTLPADRPRPARPTYAADVHVRRLDAELTTAVRRFSERENASLFTVLLAACSVLLNRYLGQDDLVIGSLVSGRTRVETEQLIGSFANPLPLRVRLGEQDTLRDVVRQARSTMSTTLDHQDVPFDRVIRDLGLDRESAQTSLSPMWINVLTVPDTDLKLPGLRITPEPSDPTQTSVDLTLNATPVGDRLHLQWHYMTELFDAGTIAVFAEQFERMLRQVVTAPETPVWQVELGRSAPLSRPAAATTTEGFVELFQRQVALTPYAPAVVCDGVATGYAELNRDADRIAHRLRALGVGRDVRVGILVDRPLLPAAVLGVLKAGGAYVPLDPTYPPERISFVLADAGAQVLLSQQRLADLLGSARPETVLLDEPLDGVDTDPADLPDPAALAYVVYTSGSTGRPKGAMIEHGSLVTFARDVAARLGLGAGDRFLQFASPGFDVLAEELFPIWLAGGAVVVPTRHLIAGEDDLVDLIARERVSVIELPTAYWHEWIRELDRLDRQLPDCLRLLIIGGERVLPDRLAMWRRVRVPLMHVYGLTEATVSSTFFRVDPAAPAVDWPNLPIGTPLPSADLRVLDRRLRPVPDGGTGELYIGGVSLARGYLGTPGLTALRFVADPAGQGRRLYRTGDVVRCRVDGDLEFISRVDTQIKIRGFRVEPTEIESMLTRHPDIAEAVVTRYEPAPGDRRLAGYLVPRSGAAVPSTADLRRFLETELPAYMVPAVFVALDALPLSANGKVDRDRLPAPGQERQNESAGYGAPESPAQARLAEIIASVIGLARVGIHDNFFEIGGDSILAVQVVARAQEAGLKLTPYDLFAHASVAALAEVVGAGQSVDAEQADVTGPVPLAPPQRWFSTAELAEPRQWNLSVLLDLGADLEIEVLRDAVERVIGHHDGLRQRFLLAGSRTRSRIAPRGDGTPFEAHDLFGCEPAEQDRQLDERCAHLQRSLDPAVGPLLRVALFRMGGARPDRLAIVVHHLIADQVSMRILLEDLETAVVQRAGGEEPRFLPKTTSWLSWGRRLSTYGASAEVQSQRTYWTELVSAPAGRLPDDLPVEAGQDTEASTRTVAATLDAGQTIELLKAGDTVQDLLLTALARTLGEWTGAARHLVDLERHDRQPIFDDVDLTRTVGWFSHTHPVALPGESGAAPQEILRQVGESLRAVPSAGTGWQLLRQHRDPVPPAPADLLFTYTGTELQPVTGAFALAAGTVGGDRSPAAPRPYGLEVRTSVAGGELTVRWAYSEQRHHRATIDRLAARYVEHLRTLTAPADGEQDGSRSADFPFARVDQADLDTLLGRLASGPDSR